MNKKILIAVIGILITGAVLLTVFLKINPSNKNIPADEKSTVRNIISVESDLCGYFPKEFISQSLGKDIIKTESQSSQTTSVCQYYTDETGFVTLRLNNLNAENQKKGQIALGRSITSDTLIKTEHFVVVQENGLINGIYLILDPNLFIAVDRTSAKAASEEQIIILASKVAEKIQNGTLTESNTQNDQTDKPITSLPNQEETIRNFIKLVNEGKTTEAVNMLSSQTAGDNNQKQAWSAQFNAFNKLTLRQIEPAGENKLRVSLDVEMKPEALNAPLPFYGYENGENIRWITLSDSAKGWTIAEIATSP